MRRLLAAASLASALQLISLNLAAAQEMYLGEVRMFAFNWCPVGWLATSGQLLSISSNAALFSLLGTNFGGNGTTNFALPNLQGRAPVGFGTPGQPFAVPYGNAAVSLTVTQLPAHSHPFFGTSSPNISASPAGALLPTFPGGEKIYSATSVPANTPMSGTSIGPTGGNQPVPTQSPSLAMNWCIATQGIYPSRP